MAGKVPLRNILSIGCKPSEANVSNGESGAAIMCRGRGIRLISQIDVTSLPRVLNIGSQESHVRSHCTPAMLAHSQVRQGSGLH